ncbi:MAG: gamma-glutamyltransferase [Candidatus Melainabacteria bacterium HGW-Melainabacteria-1]|nr:MAG: gamma-glutamyltransferase [Candidatus Melainabacteria bacterium HGW-Melainabacteria-1]
MLQSRISISLAALVGFFSSGISSSVQAAFPTPVSYQQGVVASDHPLASAAGRDVLQRGGNAFDAAIATSLVLAVTRNQSTGIGGGGFMLLRTAQGKNQVLDYRETAPAAAKRDMFLDQAGEPIPDASTTGYRAVAVPGLIAGLERLRSQYGPRPLAELMQPAIQLAEQGFSVDAHFASAAEILAQRNPRADLKAVFFKAGQPPRIGESVRNPELAATLRSIAKEGASAFYTGEIARKIVTAMQAHGGLITAQDLARYQPKERKPIQGRYRGYEVLTMPPPSSGGTALLTVLNLLEPYALGWNSLDHGSSGYVGLVTEAMKHAFADRANYLGDPDFITVPVEQLISKTYAQSLQPKLQQAGLRTLHRDQYGLKGLSYATAAAPAAPPSDHGTTHYSIMDRFGNVVAATETINTYFGSQVVIPGTGIVMNNEMDDFSKRPGVPNAFGLIGTEANAIAPGKRPLSSMTPTIVLRDGKPFLALGASGGPRIITGTLQTLLNVVDFGMDVEAAVSAPRFHHQWVPETLYIEREMPFDVRSALMAKGHQLASGTAENVVQAVMFRDGVFTGAADPRKGGRPEGY